MRLANLNTRTDRNERSASPFWRNRPVAPRQGSVKSTTVIGASYSHADMLKFDSLYAYLHYIGLCLD